MTAISTSNELVRFLLARVDEDDVALRKLTRGTHDDTVSALTSLDRLRAEMLAKRRIIGTAQQLLALRDQPFEKPVRDAASQMLRCLAAPYAGHAGFREEWRTSQRR